LSQDPEVQKTARLLVEGLRYALEKVAPFEENLALGYMLGIKKPESAGHPGQALRHIFEAMSEIGANLAQKVYQRRLLPPDYLKYLEDFTEKTRVPTRLSIFELAESALDVPDIDQVLAIEDVVGAASSRIVLKVRFKTGQIGTSPSTLKKPRL